MADADQAAEALVADDGEVLRDRLRRIVDEHVAVAEEVLRVVVEELRLGGPRRAQEVRVAEARAERELTIGERDRAAERDAGAGEVRLRDVDAAVRGERPRAAVRLGVGGEAEPEVVDDDRVALDDVDDEDDVPALRAAAERELHVAEEAGAEETEAREEQLLVVDVERVARAGTARSAG